MATQSPPRPRRWLKRLIGLTGLLVLIGVVAYFVVTSATFFQLIVLPKLSQSLNAQVTVRDATISPFSRIVLYDLKVHTTGSNPLLTTRELTARYNLRQILGGTLAIDEVRLDEPRLHVVLHADGTSNLDPLLESDSSSGGESGAPDPDAQPARIHLRQATLHQARAQVIRELADGGQETFAFSNLNFTVTNVRNDGSGTFSLTSGFLWRIDSADPATNGFLAGAVEGRFTFDLNDELQPVRLQGRTDLAVREAQGALANANQLQSAVEAQVTPTHIRQLQLSFNRLGTNLGEVHISGPFDLALQQGDLHLTAGAIDHHLLNLLGAGYGLQFGPDVSLRSTNQIRIRPDGTQLAGQTRVDNLALALGTNTISEGAVFLELAAELSDQSQNVQSVLVLSNLGGRIGPYQLTNLTVSTRLDISNHQHVAQIRLARITLPPTERAANEANLTGYLDLSDVAGPEGQLSFQADALDLTPFYALARAGAPDSHEPSPESAPPSQDPTPEEPAPIRLPVKQLRTDVQLGQVFLHDVRLSNWLTHVVIDPEKVTIKPAQLLVNGAPVKLQAEIHLDVPGYRYELDFNAQSVPIEPFANSFLDVNPGSYKGELIAQINLRGTGMTGPNLRRTLQGTVGLAFTNAEIQLISPFFRQFLSPIALLISVPDLVTSPLNHVLFQATAGQGQIQITQCQLQSPLFLAETHGAAAIADDPLQSAITDWPMRFSLRRGLADRIKLVPAETPAEVAYVALPDFIRVHGTLAAPRPKLEARALAAAGLGQLADKIPEIQELKEKAGGILRGILGGQSDTNAPSAEPFNLLDLFKKRE